MVLHVKKSVQLLRDLKRARWLPHFNEKVIKEVIDEIVHDAKEALDLYNQNSDLEEVPSDLAAGMLLYNDLVDRNRRCILAYLNYRLDRIEELRWEVGLMVPEEKLERLHDAEKSYLHEYNRLLDKYMSRYVPNCKEPLDLIADSQAPEDMNVQIRVKEDGLGEIVTSDSGVVRLRKGYQLFVKRTDIEHLIRAGKVEHVKTPRFDDVGAGF
mmetsp:Transcript_37439/g.84509  ORF Transcript_37439/g.84509 Transcript_37439/m.84509 type:complete len:212 (-) Transcript_37439:74-709(-)